MPLALLALAAVAKPIVDIVISPDDTWLAATNATDNVWIFRLSDGKLLRTLHHKPGSSLVDLEISPDGRRLVCTNRSYAGDVSPIWDTKSWKETGRIAAWISKGFADPSNGLEYAGGGRYLVGQKLYGGEIVCWNADTGAIAYEPRKLVQGRWYGIAVNPMSTLVAIYNPAEPKIRFWDFERSGRLSLWGSSVSEALANRLQMMRFSRRGDRLFIGFLRGKDGFSPAIYRPVKGNTGIVVSGQIDRFQARDLDWASDDTAIYLAGLKGQIGVWDPGSGHLVRHWTGHGGAAIKAVAAANRATFFATGGEDQVCLWDPKNGKLLRTLRLPAP